MTHRRTLSQDPDIIASAKALRRAAKRARQLGEQTGTPVYVLKRGKMVDLTQEARGRGRGRVDSKR